MPKKKTIIVSAQVVMAARSPSSSCEHHFPLCISPVSHSIQCTNSILVSPASYHLTVFETSQKNKLQMNKIEPPPKKGETDDQKKCTCTERMNKEINQNANARAALTIQQSLRTPPADETPPTLQYIIMITQFIGWRNSKLKKLPFKRMSHWFTPT